jgi:nanoRNase/pAp phosphatase (c-di-AMP/oligoRNAs hydrolase)
VDPSPRDECVERAKPKLDRLRDLAKGKKTLLAQTHDFPDPDTIASALGLTWMLESLEGLETQIGYGGVIGRAENKAMIRVLKIPMRRTSDRDFDNFDLVALLDTQPDAGNHNCPPDRTVDIVVDHHFRREVSGHEPTFFDVGGGYGSTSTKVVELVMASGLEPPINVATALFYGVKTDTQNLGREASPADMAAYLYLVPRADNKLLSEIEHPQVPLDYFRVFNKALTRGKIYGNFIVSDLGEVYTPDLCAEVAERLLQVEGVKHALAVGWFEENLFLSLRTRLPKQKNAGRILHSIVCGSDVGTAGGHGPMAGARIPVEGKSQRARADIRRRLVSQIVQAFGQDFRRFQRLVSPKEAASTTDDPPPPSLIKKNGSD